MQIFAYIKWGKNSNNIKKVNEPDAKKLRNKQHNTFCNKRRDTETRERLYLTGSSKRKCVHK